jgi:hypothetical protein
MVSFTSRPLYPQEKSSWYPFDKLDGPQSRSGCGGEEKNSQTVLGLEPTIKENERLELCEMLLID